MYVCICHGVTDKDIRTAASNGAHSLEALSEQLNVATCCGRCAECAGEVLYEAIRTADLPTHRAVAA